MASSRHAHRALKKFTRFTPRASWAGIICAAFNRKPSLSSRTRYRESAAIHRPHLSGPERLSENCPAFS